MRSISDPLELLTAQHEEIHDLLARATSATDAQVRLSIIDELASFVTAHLAVEQAVLYQQVASRFTPSVFAELYAEHAEIKRVLADLLWLDADDDRVEATLATISQLLQGHTAWQDEELFPTAAQGMSAAALDELGTQIQASFDLVYGTSDVALAA